MSIQFVSTSVLESEDGVDFGKETASATGGDLNKQRQQRRNQDGSLYEQLAARKDEKQGEFDKTGELLRAPTSGLDQDDVDFFNDVEMRDNSAYRDRIEQDDAKVAHFMRKQRDAEQEQNEARFSHEATKSVLSKRKTEDISPHNTANDEQVIVMVKKVKKSESCMRSTSIESPTKNISVAALLSGYESESD